MNEHTRLGLKILTGAALLGVLGDALLRVIPWGINIPLWAAALAVTVLALAPFRREALAGGGYWLLVPAAFFSACVAWRDSPLLKMLDIFALIIALSLLMLRAQGKKLRHAGLLEYALGSFITVLDVMFSPVVLLLKDIDWKELRSHRASQPALAVGRGILFSIPPVLIFGGLLVGADPVFEALIKNTLHLSFFDLLSHCFLAAFFAWVVGGFLRGMLLGKEADLVAANAPSLPTLGITETSIVLGLVDALFFAFVLVQLRYFFGGSELVMKTTGLTYADYARRGFFELVAVAALVLPLLLVVHWLLRKDNKKSERIFRVLAGAQILLLFVIMASALERMRLYEQEFGLTELRLYTTAFMGWLAVVFVWFGFTVLRGNRKPFVFGALIVGYVLIAALQVLNPDALIARTNIARAIEGRKFDAGYAGWLSADAVPTLVQALPHLGPSALNSDDRCKLSTRLLTHWAAPGENDWRTWSLSCSEAIQAVKEHESELRAMACPAANGVDNHVGH
ncbi:MAG: DUF4153 domain-containing protein [Terriglobia bacterium]